MPELDGGWDVSRTGGLLPPLLGVRKEIVGTRGQTLLPGGVLGAPFDVVGLELHYRRPFAGFVDILAPNGDGFAGQATFRRREFGRFEMTAIRGGTMTTLNEQLIKHLDDILDLIEATSERVVIFDIKETLETARELAAVVLEAAEAV